jgi:hypothetical protein
MVRALRIRPELGGSFEDPGGLVVCDIDPATGAAPTEESTGSRREIFLSGTEPVGAQVLPDGSVGPDGPMNADGQSKSPDDNNRGLADPTLPPDTRKPENTQDQGWSIGRKLKDFLGGGKPKPSPSPTPTPKPAEESGLQSRKQSQGRSPSAVPRATPLKPVVFSSERTTQSTIPAARSKPKPPPQVATRPRKVTERKQTAEFVAKPPAAARSAPPSKDKSVAKKNDEKKSDQRAETKTIVRREKTADQAPKPVKIPPTPTPSPKPTPAAVVAAQAPTPSIPKGEGTFTLEVCSVSGLLPVRGACKNTVRQRFKLGIEPTRFCNPSHH